MTDQHYKTLACFNLSSCDKNSKYFEIESFFVQLHSQSQSRLVQKVIP